MQEADGRACDEAHLAATAPHAGPQSPEIIAGKFYIRTVQHRYSNTHNSTPMGVKMQKVLVGFAYLELKNTTFAYLPDSWSKFRKVAVKLFTNNAKSAVRNPDKMPRIAE
jgi:hypothetical protein